MEQGSFLFAGTGRSRRERLVTLDDFRSAFGRVAHLDNDGLVPVARRRGDHDLNPGMPEPDKTRAAAVLVPVVGRDDGLTILLTRRSDSLPVHKGQISFPGGRVEEDDVDDVETALRETEEEIGLGRDLVEVIGRLDTYTTRTGFEVTPVVGLVRPPFDLTPDPVEVAEIFEVPLDFVLDPVNHERHSREWQQTVRHFWVLPYRHHYIWGATAGMLVNLADVMRSALRR